MQKNELSVMGQTLIEGEAGWTLQFLSLQFSNSARKKVISEEL